MICSARDDCFINPSRVLGGSVIISTSHILIEPEIKHLALIKQKEICNITIIIKYHSFIFIFLSVKLRTVIQVIGKHSVAQYYNSTFIINALKCITLTLLHSNILTHCKTLITLEDMKQKPNKSKNKIGVVIKILHIWLKSKTYLRCYSNLATK